MKKSLFDSSVETSEYMYLNDLNESFEVRT